MSKAVKLGTYLDFLKAGDNELLQYQAISGRDKAELLKMSLPDLAKAVDEFKDSIRGTGRKLYQELKLDGRRFCFHPNLDYLTFAEYIDIDTLLNSFPQSLPSILAILYRPPAAELGKTYKLEEYDAQVHLENASLFRQVDLEAVNGVMVFFYHLRSDLVAATLDFLNTATLETVTEIETIAADIQQQTRQPKS